MFCLFNGIIYKLFCLFNNIINKSYAYYQPLNVQYNIQHIMMAALLVFMWEGESMECLMENSIYYKYIIFKDEIVTVNQFILISLESYTVKLWNDLKHTFFG